MANQQKTMNEVKQIIRMHQQGVAIKGMARALGMSKNTIKEYVRRIYSVNKPLEELLSMEGPALSVLLSQGSINERERYNSFLSRAEYYIQELENSKHLSYMVLWEEDFKAGKTHYRYSQFCYHLSRYRKSKTPSMVMNYEPGDKWMIDFAGDKLHIVDPDSGELTPCEILVMTMAHSYYTQIVACPSQKVGDLIEGINQGLSRLGGCPRTLVCDNLKSAVTYSDRYEPTLNDTFLDMANHYGMSVMPARVRKPKDKARVEGAVNHVYHQVYARIRNQTFHSIHGLNQCLAEMGDEFNNRVMKEYGLSRTAFFERDEQSTLQPLPSRPYQLMQQYKLKVGQNGHIYLAGCKQYYSVPYALIGQQATVLICNGMVKIYHRGACVATHLQSKQRYTTQTDHLASHHNAYLDAMNPELLKQRAGLLADEIKQVIELILQRGHHPEQNYKTCQGILMLEKKVGREKLIQSCSVALVSGITTFKYIERLCNNQLMTDPDEGTLFAALPKHDNIRGASHYQ